MPRIQLALPAWSDSVMDYAGMDIISLLPFNSLYVEHRQRTIVFYSSLDLALFEASLKAGIYTLCSYYIMRDKYIEIKPVALS